MPATLETFIFGNEWSLFALLVILLLAIAEGGYRAGLRLFRAKDDARRNQIGGIQAAVLGLLGLLLGFTFSMGVNRYETRRDFVLKEANAIGTTYLRAGFLPEAQQEPVKELLRQYLDVRIQTHAAARDIRAVSEGLRRSQEIQHALWQHAEAVAKQAPTPLTAIFVNALNETIDTDAARVAAARNEIPSGVWFLLIFVAAAGCFVSSYGSGALGERSGFTAFLLPVLLTIVITSIFDLTHTKQGVIEISQQPLLDLQQSIAPKNR